jgi:regulator of protease activity HflC (stomatin/prohibitin superfamily)
MEELSFGNILAIGFALIAVITIAKTARIGPQRSNFVIERLGKYSRTLDSGFHILIPFIDKVAYQHTLKEEVIDVERQTCVTRDNIQVGINGVLYMQVVDAHKASYGINNYRYAASQLAQTTMRSVIGQTDLDKTFEERAKINEDVVNALDEAATPWGIKVLRYEISDIELPASIKDALEQQMRAERERRAAIAKSEGERQAMINVSEGQKQEVINRLVVEYATLRSMLREFYRTLQDEKDNRDNDNAKRLETQQHNDALAELVNLAETLGLNEAIRRLKE